MSCSLWLKPALRMVLLTMVMALANERGLAAENSAGETVILQTRAWSPDGKVPTGTIWRTFQTWQTDIARTEKGQLIRVDPMKQRGGGPGGRGQIVEASAVYGSPLPRQWLAGGGL